MASFTRQPQVFEAFQWTGDMDALHAWLDPMTARDAPLDLVSTDFTVDLDPDTGNLRLLQWGYYFYARPGDWVTWESGPGINVHPNTDANTPYGFVPFSGTVPAPVAGDFPPAAPVPDDTVTS